MTGLPRFAALLAASLALSAATALHHPAWATVYGLKSCGSSEQGGACAAGVSGGGSMAPTVLFSFGESANALDPGAFVVTNGGENIHADALAIDSAGAFFAYELTTVLTEDTERAGFTKADVTASRLVILNPTSGAVVSTLGAALDGRDIRGAAFGPGGRFWAIDATGDELLEIDPTTGGILGPATDLTLCGAPFDLHTSSDLAFRSDGVAFLVNLDGFYQLDLASGALSLLFTAASQEGAQFAGIAFSDAAASDLLFAYEVAGTDDIRNFDLDDGNLQTQQIGDVIPTLNGQTFNAGLGALAAQVTFDTVPEPGALGLLGLALAGLALRRRRGGA